MEPGKRRTIQVTSTFNLLVGLIFIVTAIVGLIQLRWFHKTTVVPSAKYAFTSLVSYFPFALLIIIGLVLLSIAAAQLLDGRRNGSGFPGYWSITRSTLCHSLASVGLLAIMIIWLLNTGEIVRDTVSKTLDVAYNHYQFSNRSNHYTVAVDEMQLSLDCCGRQEFSDFPRLRLSTGLANGYYPGSCCGKSTFGVNAKVQCMSEDVKRAKQADGCVTRVSNYYDTVSVLVVPLALIALFVNIVVTALLGISRRNRSLDDLSDQ